MKVFVLAIGVGLTLAVLTQVVCSKQLAKVDQEAKVDQVAKSEQRLAAEEAAMNEAHRDISLVRKQLEDVLPMNLKRQLAAYNGIKRRTHSVASAAEEIVNGCSYKLYSNRAILPFPSLAKDAIHWQQGMDVRECKKSCREGRPVAGCKSIVFNKKGRDEGKGCWLLPEDKTTYERRREYYEDSDYDFYQLQCEAQDCTANCQEIASKLVKLTNKVDLFFKSLNSRLIKLETETECADPLIAAEHCLNGGTCFEMFGNGRARCHCTAEWTGEKCEERYAEMECADDAAEHCRNGGTCFEKNFDGKAHCHCTAEWTGERCEERYIKPCVIGGYC